MGPIKFTLIKKLKSNNRFNYTPRYYDGKDDVDDSRFPTRFDAYADSFNKNDFSSHWSEARKSKRNRNNVEFNKTVLIIIAMFVLLFLWFIDFDLTIFT
ncbi:MAG: hypothetical protein K0U54_09365 [Bacteroidetes bacterium]|nr:hypothetical protein [Bacteroidota bacterium]